MQRLLADAEKLTGVKYDINNLSDVYSAIHAIQENLDITGTTAKEASTTFTGSFESMKAAAQNVEKLLRSAIANWETKNDRKAEDGELYISRIFVDEGVTMKRMRPAPQGRGYRIRKRSNHVTLFVDSKADANNDK